MDDDLKIIKKLYGEKMMHLCRELFSVILEIPGKLSNILLNSFEPNKCLYDDLVDCGSIVAFKNYIYSIFDIDREEKSAENKVIKTPSELLSEAGYILYECKTEEEIQSFRKYYYRGTPTPIYKGGKPEPYKGEELCTFNGERLEDSYVFFAVKKDVDKIKREDFKDPKRQDEYGTSVISIQFSKDSHNTLSIKNRYNHTVPNCDSTFSNNLDNIIPGLTESFKKYYNLSSKNDDNDFELEGYVRASDGKFYKYNCEENNIYYCPDNIIIDNFNVKRDYQQMERYIIADNFIIDLKEKTITSYFKSRFGSDGFLDDLVDIEKIDVEKDKETGNKEIKITIEGKEPIIIKIDKENNIIGYVNNNIKEVKDDFLRANRKLKEISLSNVESIGGWFLLNNEKLTNLDLPKVKTIGDSFLYNNKCLENISLPNVESISDFCLFSNIKLESISLPNIRYYGFGLLINNEKIDFNNILRCVRINKVKRVSRDLATLINMSIKNVLQKLISRTK